MLAKINSAGLQGMEAYSVSVQVDESYGLPRSVVVGNVSANVREALEKCQVVLKNAGLSLPPRRLTINLQPAEIRKHGCAYDLPILVGILRALCISGRFPLEDYGFFGELGLDGQLLPVRGTLSLMTELQKSGRRGAVVPCENAQEAMVIEGMDIIGVKNIEELLLLLRDEQSFLEFPRERLRRCERYEKKEDYPDFSEIKGQQFAVRGAVIAAAGGHSLLFSGTAGSGKSMIAKRIPGILPPLTRQEDIELSKIYSVAGLLPPGEALYGRRPFRAPHPGITAAALLGGSFQGRILPGELSLASKGVLLLDELPLFSKTALEALRLPLEEKKVLLNRMSGSCLYPADGMLVAAMNPCPCGFYPDRERCKCSPLQVRSYQRGISRPILERLDICVEVAPVGFQEAFSEQKGRSSAELRELVMRAREIQGRRFSGNAQCHLNGDMGIRELKHHCRLREEEERYLQQVFRLRQLSMRGCHKLLKIARSIADLEGEREIRREDLAEALAYRGLEERLYGEERGGADEGKL